MREAFMHSSSARPKCWPVVSGLQPGKVWCTCLLWGCRRVWCKLSHTSPSRCGAHTPQTPPQSARWRMFSKTWSPLLSSSWAAGPYVCKWGVTKGGFHRNVHRYMRHDDSACHNRLTDKYLKKMPGKHLLHVAFSVLPMLRLNKMIILKLQWIQSPDIYLFFLLTTAHNLPAYKYINQKEKHLFWRFHLDFSSVNSALTQTNCWYWFLITV